MGKNKKITITIISATLLLAVTCVVLNIPGNKKVSSHTTVDTAPKRSSHNEVDASTGATLLWNQQKKYGNIKVAQEEAFAVIYPFDNSVFPADFSPASFIWKSSENEETKWKVSFSVGSFEHKETTRETKFKPSVGLWEKLKKKSQNQKIVFSVSDKNTVREIAFSFSEDSVKAPIFYRAVPLPFSYANKYRDRLEWYLGDVAQNKKHLMLDDMPVCANCHSFTKNGAKFAMDVDYGNDKGNYAISGIENVSEIGLENIISWTDFKRSDGIPTFGLLAKISPDGKYAISTVKDKSIFVPVDKSFWYSQLFFPVKGIQVYYDVEKEKFAELNGASDPDFVQSSAEWSPNMENILFSRATYKKDTSLEAQENVVLDMRFAEDYINREKDFKFDLYSVPWNDGKGGQPEAIKGASENGMSNYFARYSPDGKWIVFCKAENFMLLQPDSKLYIMPAKGGKPRLMNCNTNEMNSWHSFSPNSKWMVFSTKYFGPYTQLFLTHIDENGNDTPPVWLEQLTVNMKAANIPEFVNVDYDNWHAINDKFTKTEDYASTVAEYDLDTKDINSLVQDADGKIAANPNDYRGYYLKAVMLSQQGKHSEAKKIAGGSIDMIKKLPEIGFKEYGDMGLLYSIMEDYPKAIEMSNKSLELNPKHVFALMTLGDVYYQLRDYENTNRVYSEIIKQNNSEDYRLKRAQLQMQAKSLYKEAIEDLDVILSKEDCHVIALQLLIKCYSELNDNVKVEELNTKLIGCEPYVGYFSRGSSYMKTGEFQKAADDFTEGLKYRKDDVRAIFFRGNAYFQLKQYKNALSDFQRLKQLLGSGKGGQLPIKQQQLDDMIQRCGDLAGK